MQLMFTSESKTTWTHGTHIPKNHRPTDPWPPNLRTQGSIDLRTGGLRYEHVQACGLADPLKDNRFLETYYNKSQNLVVNENLVFFFVLFFFSHKASDHVHTGAAKSSH